jgi:sulfatase modifying factor 1
MRAAIRASLAALVVLAACTDDAAGPDLDAPGGQPNATLDSWAEDHAGPTPTIDVTAGADGQALADSESIADSSAAGDSGGSDGGGSDGVGGDDIAVASDAASADVLEIEDIAVDAETSSLDAAPSDASEADDAADATPLAPNGTLTAPYPLDPLPAVVSGDTTAVTSDVIDTYVCAAATDESGPEVVYVVHVEAAGALTVTVDDVPGDSVDVDVHVLDAPDGAACIARHNTTLTVTVGVGTYYVVVDTWVDGAGLEKPGPYTLSVSWAPNTSPCGPSTCTASDLPTPNGVTAEAPGVGACPAGMVAVTDFCIDRYEASLIAVAGDGTLSPVTPFAPSVGTVRAISAKGLIPSGYVSGIVAAAACAESGKRLCTDAEWLRACRGPGDTTYPYGNDRLPGRCNDARACHPAIQYFETTDAWIWSELNHPCLNQLEDGLASTGEFAGCATADGVFDMMGNLHEWTADPNGTFRGGFYVDTKLNGNGCLYSTTAHDVAHHDYSTGFRCCADAQVTP